MVQVPHGNEDVCALADGVAFGVAIEPPWTDRHSNGADQQRAQSELQH